MANLERDVRRNRKIARTLIRLKHSLVADDEIDEYVAAQEEALVQGELLLLDVQSMVEEL